MKDYRHKYIHQTFEWLSFRHKGTQYTFENSRVCSTHFPQTTPLQQFNPFYVLKYSEKKWICFIILHHSSTLKLWYICLDIELPISNIQYHGWWWSGGTRGLGISCYGIHLHVVFAEYSELRAVKDYFYPFKDNIKGTGPIIKKHIFYKLYTLIWTDNM